MDAVAHKQSEEEMTNKDTEKLLLIFPEEIWRFIYSKVDLNSVEKMCNASLHFRNHWREQRTNFLFPKVLQVLSRGWLDPSSASEWELREAYRNFFKIRLVCRSWTNAFDNYYRSPRPCTIEDFQFPIAAIRKKIHCEFNYYDDGDTNRHNSTKFLEHFDSTHARDNKERSPFVGKTLHVRYTQSDINQENSRFFYERVVGILSKYGKHVKHLSLEDEVSELEWKGYLKLAAILHATPNLEYLKIYHNLGMPVSSSTHHPIPSGALFRKLDYYMKLNPLPTLPSLQSIKIYGNGSSLCVLNELLVKNNHISQLVISNLSIAQHSFLVAPLANLRELSLTIYSNDDLSALKDPCLNWPLTKLAVELKMWFQYVDWSQLFSIVASKWSDTLTDFLLTIPSHNPETYYNILEGISASLYLKKVQRLQLKFCSYSSLDFILPLKDTLEYLSVIDSSNDGNKKIIEMGERVKFWACIKNPLKSNIWKHFPKLDRVQYYVDHSNNYAFGRQDWLKNKSSLQSRIGKFLTRALHVLFSIVLAVFVVRFQESN